MTFQQLYTIFFTHIHMALAPARCNGCMSLLVSRAVLCVECNRKIIPVLSTKLVITHSSVMPVFAAGAYQDVLKRLICAKHARYQLAGTYLGEIIWYRTPIASMPIDYIVSIPLHWTRKLSRGFNQTEEMALALSRMSGKPVAPVLKRKKRTLFQTTLSAADRLNNVSDAFELTSTAIDDTRYAGKHLVLVDDLMTTGATLRMACRQLLKLKPASIICVVAARTM